MEFISVVEFIGTVAFAMSGALVAIEKELDYYGIACFAIITSFGGGIIRDMLINRSLPVFLTDPQYMIISIFSAMIVIVLYKKIIHFAKILQIFDAAGLAAFTAIGAEVAVNNGLDQPFVVITLALLTGTGGGVIRDVFASKIPYVFQKEIYAVASIIGAVFFILINKAAGEETALYGCFAITLFIRLYSMKKDIHLKKVSREEKI